MAKEIYSKDFENFLKKIEILYVEDEEHIRELLEARLAREFGKIHSAQNGEVGLYKFEMYRPKIVVTDIRMPIMDGLEMLAEIKEKSPYTRAIVTTAHSDIDFMLKSIEIGIDRYVVKPINVDELFAAIKKICFQLYNEYLATEFQRKSATEQINSVVADMFEQMSLSLPNPMILYSSGKPVFMNTAFTELFAPETVGLIRSGKKMIDEIIDIGVDRKTKITIPSGRKKIFLAYKTDFDVASHMQMSLYSFNDLTAFEYQNAKLKSYTDILYELLKVKSVESARGFDTASDKNMQSEPKKERQAIFEILGSQEIEALKRNHVIKISATEYVKEIGEDILEELDELKEIEAEISDILDALEDDGMFGEHIAELGAKFLSYSHSIGKLLEFEDLAVAVRNFGNYLFGLKTQDEVRWSKVISYTENIKLDLVSWRNTIFVEQNTADIHYLDSSLMSSCVQIQFADKQESTFDDENDLELF